MQGLVAQARGQTEEAAERLSKAIETYATSGALGQATAEGHLGRLLLTMEGELDTRGAMLIEKAAAWFRKREIPLPLEIEDALAELKERAGS